MVHGLPVAFSSRLCRDTISNSRAFVVIPHHNEISNPIMFKCSSKQNRFRNELYKEDKDNTFKAIYKDCKSIFKKEEVEDIGMSRSLCKQNLFPVKDLDNQIYNQKALVDEKESSKNKSTKKIKNGLIETMKTRGG
mmetsp:Transcript_17483/g.18146  ORF Transcript_17483/g.18146 Transcript_17483/m.18146 type:complete len:136 (+) Transcript_17483:3-410(+)